MAGVFIAVHAKGRIFLRQPLHGIAELVLVGLGLGLDRDGNDRRGKYDVLEHDGFVFIAQRIAGGYALQAHARSDIARVNGVNFLAFVGVHAQEAAHALTRLLG